MKKRAESSPPEDLLVIRELRELSVRTLHPAQKVSKLVSGFMRSLVLYLKFRSSREL